MNNPVVSIVVPVYNAEKFLSQAIESILNQSFNNFELICVNDCSSDASEEILRQYENSDDRMKVIHLKSNIGEGGARNIGIKKASGEYLISCDADDLLPQRSIEFLYNAAQENNSDVVIGSLRYIDESCNEIGIFKIDRIIKNTDIFHSDDLLIHFLGYHQCMLFRRSLFSLYATPYRENCLTSADGYFLFRIMFEVKNITLIDDFVYMYRLNQFSNTNTKRTLRWCYDDLYVFDVLYNSAAIHKAKNIADRRFYYEFFGMVYRSFIDLTRKDFFDFISSLQIFIKNNNVFIDWMDLSNAENIYKKFIFLSIANDRRKILFFLLLYKRLILYSLKINILRKVVNRILKI